MAGQWFILPEGVREDESNHSQWAAREEVMQSGQGVPGQEGAGGQQVQVTVNMEGGDTLPD
jgi:hypothetical protein